VRERDSYQRINMQISERYRYQGVNMQISEREIQLPMNKYAN
jgi:hypothetical protein